MWARLLEAMVLHKYKKKILTIENQNKPKQINLNAKIELTISQSTNSSSIQRKPCQHHQIIHRVLRTK